jgi:hypothetical protein
LFLLSATTNNCIQIGLHKISWTRRGFDTYWTPTFPICTDRHQQNRRWLSLDVGLQWCIRRFNSPRMRRHSNRFI